MPLPFPENRFDAAVMAPVIFFLPKPAQGVAEMARVVGAGSTVAAYAWDFASGGSPTSPILAELRAMGLTPPSPPSASVARIEALRQPWRGAGLEANETREITVARTFADLEALWVSSLAQASVGPSVAAMAPADAAGHITYAARANAIRGRVRN